MAKRAKKQNKSCAIFFSIVAILVVIIIGVSLLICEPGEGCYNFSVYFAPPLVILFLICGTGALIAYRNYVKLNDE